MKVSDMRIKSDGTTQIHGFKGYLFNLTTIGNFQQINFSHKLFVCLDLLRNKHYLANRLCQSNGNNSLSPHCLGPKVEDKLLRPTTSESGSEKVQKPVNSTAKAALLKAKHQAFERGRVAEIVGVTLAFAVVIVVMSVAFIAMWCQLLFDPNSIGSVYILLYL